MATQYGLTSLGFLEKSQQTIISEWNASLQQRFGSNINLSPESVFGQIVAIGSAREALIWQEAGAVYRSQYPSGAEGVSVDNILALNNLKRLQASPTLTNPTPVQDSTTLITEYGLVLFGTPGTLIPAGSLVQTQSNPPIQFSIDANITIGAAANAIQTLYFSNVPTVGVYSLSIIDQYVNTLTTPNIPFNALANQTQLSFSAVPGAGAFEIHLTQAGVSLTTAAIPFNANAAAVQAAINALAGYSGVLVSGSFAAGFTLTWGAICNPVTTIVANTLGVAVTVIDSIQSAINNLFDAPNAVYPYTDAQVAARVLSFDFTFGSGTVIGTNPVSSNQQIALMEVASNNMQSGLIVTNLAVSMTQTGTPAQGVGTATATTTGPNFVAAGTINTIGSPIGGWTGVTNQLDCLTGSNTESDTDALLRRSNNLNSLANGPIQAIVQKVEAVSGVTTAKGFENLYQAALQVITFGSIPVAGLFVLIVDGSLTPALAYNATAAQWTTAIRTIPGASLAVVTGDYANGFTIDFNGSSGGQPMPLSSVYSNTTGVSITPKFGRPGNSFEIVAEGGVDLLIAKAIYGSKPAGIQPYGSTVVQIQDQFGSPYDIGFSRPTTVPIYINLTLVTDLLTASNPQFSPASIATIQQDLIAIGSKVGIGGLIIGFGTNGLIGAFNEVPGLVGYQLTFGVAPNPTQNTNIQLLPEQVPIFETFNIKVQYS